MKFSSFRFRSDTAAAWYSKGNVFLWYVGWAVPSSLRNKNSNLSYFTLLYKSIMEKGNSSGNIELLIITKSFGKRSLWNVQVFSITPDLLVFDSTSTDEPLIYAAVYSLSPQMNYPVLTIRSTNFITSSLVKASFKRLIKSHQDGINAQTYHKYDHVFIG